MADRKKLIPGGAVNRFSDLKAKDQGSRFDKMRKVAMRGAGLPAPQILESEQTAAGTGQKTIDYGLMTQKTVGTDATLILEKKDNRIGLVLFNPNANTVYIGTSDQISTTTGFPLVENSGISFDEYTGAVYAVCGASVSLGVIEL